MIHGCCRRRHKIKTSIYFSHPPERTRSRRNQKAHIHVSDTNYKIHARQRKATQGGSIPSGARRRVEEGKKKLGRCFTFHSRAWRRLRRTGSRRSQTFRRTASWREGIPAGISTSRQFHRVRSQILLRFVFCTRRVQMATIKRHVRVRAAGDGERREGVSIVHAWP